MLFALLLAAQAPAGATIEERPKLLVLDFRDEGVGENVVRIAHETLVAHLAKDARVEVVSSEDMRRQLDVESQKRALGCTGDESCLAEIADALGARLLMHGTAGKLGELVVVNVSLYDGSAQKSVGRETIEVAKLDELPGPLRAAGDRLLATLLGAPVVTNTGPNPMLLWSGVGVGAAGAVAAIIGGALTVTGTGKLAKPDFATKSDGQLELDVGWRTALGGLVGLGVGAALIPIAFFVE